MNLISYLYDRDFDTHTIISAESLPIWGGWRGWGWPPSAFGHFPQMKKQFGGSQALGVICPMSVCSN